MGLTDFFKKNGGGLVGGALGVGAGIFGGIAASKAMKKVKKNLEAEKKQNQDWFDRRYNEDATQRADAQRILTKTEEMIRNRNRQAAGVQAVMGGTDESVAAEKAANSAALADATSRIAVAGDARKDNIESAYRAKDSELNQRLNDLEVGKAQAISDAVMGVADAGGNIASMF